MLTLELEAPGCKGKGKRQSIVCFGHYKTLEQRPIDERGGGREWGGPRWRWRRSVRIRQQSMSRWHGPNDDGGGAAVRRTRRRSGRAAVGEAVSEDPTIVEAVEERAGARVVVK
jgi:hypothetical protein